VLHSAFVRNLYLTLAFIFTWPVFAGRPRVGELAPDFQLNDSTGKTWKLSDFRGSVVLVNFWATWCGPCIEEIPSMDFFNEMMKAKRVNVLAVSVDNRWADIENFWVQLTRRPSFLTLLDANRGVSEKLFGVVKFPETFLIDSNGTVQKIIIGATNWADEAFLGEVEGILNNLGLENQEKKLKTK